MSEIKLTQLSPGAGCGCKIAPSVLEDILRLRSSIAHRKAPELLVGNDSKDDAAVYDIGGGQAVISTTDFFTPIVDDPFDFGRIAATNALSDVYAMAGRPLMAIAVLGWPLEKLSSEVAGLVIEGACHVCDNAGITLAGGHSIDISDPVFGLAVTGIVPAAKVKQNSTAEEGCSLFLTKPLGIGIITTAEKKGIVRGEDMAGAVEVMTTLNTIGTEFSDLGYVTAMTDVTGFGLLGHLLEICESSRVAAELFFEKIPLLPNIGTYAEQKSFPGGTFRNWSSYGSRIGTISEAQKHILCDPQTSGGLLVAVKKENTQDFVQFCSSRSLDLQAIGRFTAYDGGETFITVS